MEGGWTIVGLGESLWDLLPSGRRIGGAPINVVLHARQLLAGFGGKGVVASRVGSDQLGNDLLAEWTARDLRVDFVQRDPLHATGTVAVETSPRGATYAFAPHVAWDHLEFTPAWRRLAESCSAVCFGTLTQRANGSREAIHQFLDAAQHAVRLFDVNLRPPFFDREILVESCRRASIVKLNEHELPNVVEALDLPAGAPVDQLAQLRAHCELDAVVYTRGRRGTMMLLPDRVISPPTAAYPAADAADDVGAGDACAAGILAGWLRGLPPLQIAELANHLGAFVASQCGATPTIPKQIVRRINDSRTTSK